MSSEDRLQKLFEESEPHGPIRCVRVREEGFNRTCRRAPQEAWKVLLRELALPQQLTWNILDILPISPVEAEIFLPESQIASFESVVKQRILDPSSYRLQETDLKRRLSLYRRGFFKELRLAALQGFDRTLQIRLLQEAAVTPPSFRHRHRNIKQTAQHDLATLGPVAAAAEEIPTPSINVSRSIPHSSMGRFAVLGEDLTLLVPQQ
jgi:hypothetical protein